MSTVIALASVACSLTQQPDVFVVRHGQTNWNVEKRVQGQTNESQLTPEGVSQASALAERLRPYFADKQVEIWSSDLNRAHDTAKIIARTLGLSEETIHLEPLLREAKFGRFEGTDATYYTDDPDFVNYTRDQFHNAIDPIDGESYQVVAERVQKAIARIAEESQEKAVVIVSHGGAMRSIQMMHLPETGDPAQYDAVPHPTHDEIYVFDKSSQALCKADF